jgi:hypothetical protein
MKFELDLAPAQIQQLREVVDALPLNRYITFVAAILPQLPLTDGDAVDLLERDFAGFVGSIPPECSICRRHHGLEVVHASE